MNKVTRKKKKKTSPIMRAAIEMAKDLKSAGIIDKTTYKKIVGDK
jgi:hypothetical protein